MSEQRHQIPLPTPPPPAGEESPSLWRGIADGSAGPGVRAGVSVALAPLLAGVAFFGSYVVAGWAPRWARSWNGMFYPSDEIVGAMLVLAAAGYVACLCWLWTRGQRRMNEFWKAGMLTAALTLLTTIVGLFVEESRMFRGAEEVLIAGVVCVGGAAAILVWVQAAHRFARRRPLHNTQDGALDLRCPSCGYRMVGLHESRCPECGTAYTLDELLARQHFATVGRPRDLLAPTPAIPAPHGGNGTGTA